MVSSSSIPPPPPQGLDVRIRLTAIDIRETINRGREVMQQAREAMVKANLILDGQADHNGTPPSPPNP